MVEVMLPEYGASLPRAPIACHVLVVDGRWVALEAVDKLVALRLPRAMEGALLVFACGTALVALKGVLVVDETPGDMRFVAYSHEGLRRKRSTRARVAVPVTVRALEAEAVFDATIVNMSVSGALLDTELGGSPGDRIEIRLSPPGRAEQTSEVVGSAVVQRTEHGRLAVEFEHAVAPDFRTEIARLVIEERRAARLRREAQLALGSIVEAEF
jgi:hypothetical protein